VSQVAVLTTINAPNEAMARLVKLGEDAGAPVIVVGDTKTPESWKQAGADFLDLKRQKSLFGALSESIPTEHYARKNLGYLHALSYSPEWIYETDDDNFPLETPFGSRGLYLELDFFSSQSRWLNMYEIFGYTAAAEKPTILWPRGFDLQSIRAKSNFSNRATVPSPIQQGLADGDPDVDALYRLILGQMIEFQRRNPLGLEKGQICPTNSQTTWWHSSVSQLMYLPSSCTFRLTDILRGFVAWRILQESDNTVSFHSPIVRQDRNQHDLIRDLTDEVQLYLLSDALVRDLLNLELQNLTTSEQLVACYMALERRGVVSKSELNILSAWNGFF